MKHFRLFPKDDGAGVESGALAHLSDLKDYMIADPDPDIREWPVRLADGRGVGTVDDLVIDTDSLVAAYLEVKVNREFRLADEDAWVLVPIRAARIDNAKGIVVIDQLPEGGTTRDARARRHAGTVPDAPQPEDSALLDEVESDRPISI